MHFLIRNIIELNLLEGAMLAAGEQGVGNKILWVNLMEILDMPNSLQAGELLITTGYKLDDQSLYHDLIPRLKQRGLCGIAIQPGYYIDQIPDYILQSADECGFPVLELPPHLTFSHMLHVLMENINLDSNIHNDTQMIALRNRLNRFVPGGAGGRGWLLPGTSPYLFLLSPAPGNSFAPSALAACIERVRACLMAQAAELQADISGEKALFILPLAQQTTLQDVTLALSPVLQRLWQQEHIGFFVGGAPIDSEQGVITAFDQALGALEVLQRTGAKKGLCTPQNVWMFDLFESLRHGNDFVRFAYAALRPVLDYDQVHGSSYLQTLATYLANECNMAQTAAKLFIHRHTLKNRLDKITQLCGVDLSQYYERLRLSLALFAYEHYMA